MDFIKKELQIDNNNVDDFDLYAVKVELHDIDGQLSSEEIETDSSNQKILQVYIDATHDFLYYFYITIKFYRYRTIKQENAFTHNLAGAMNRYDDWNRLSVRILEELEIPIRGQRQIQVNHESVDPTDIDSAAWTAMKTATYFHKLILSKGHKWAKELKTIVETLRSDLRGVKKLCENMSISAADMDTPKDRSEPPSNPLSSLIKEHFSDLFAKLFVEQQAD